MKSKPWAALVCGLLSVPTGVVAQPVSNAPAGVAACTACHAQDKVVLGPALRDIAKRYAHEPEAAELLAQRIREGSSGRWGTFPMPAQPKLSPDQARELAQWVLAHQGK